MAQPSLLPPAPPGRDLVALLDTYGVIRYLSGPVEQSLGVAPDDRVGTSLMALVHPDDRPRVALTFGMLSDAPGAGSAFECRCRHRDGSWRHFRAALEHLPQGLGPARVVLTAQDVTESRPQGERLRLLESVATHANDAILITEAEPIDDQGPRILYANPAFLRTTGYALEEVLGKTPHPPGAGHRPRPRDTIRKALSRWRPVVVELLNYRKDGSTFWVELSIVPVADGTGHFTHWVSIQRDITERRRAVEALQAAKDEAEAANRAKSEFLGRMSHELRTPLNAIMGFAQILQLDPAAAPHRPIVDDVYAAGKRLLTLINEVLDISRVEAGGLAMSLESVSLVEVVRESLNLLAPLAAARRIRLECEPPAVPPVCVLADRQRLGQVLLNLLSNAVKYSREGDSVSVSGTAAGVRVRVADTGPGLPPDKLARLFTPFDRLGAESTGVEGTGLGLSLSKRLVEAMDGTMGAESEPGRGCTFWFELPSADAPVAGLAPPAAPADTVFAASPPGSHLVLYVEDNPANVRVVEMALAHRPGVRLMSALQGSLGADLAAQHRPDLVLLDLHLPDLGGEEVLRRLRENPATRGTPVVVLSADATPRQVARLRAAGATDYLTKPLDLRDLLRVVDAALSGERPARNRLMQGTAP